MKFCIYAGVEVRRNNDERDSQRARSMSFTGLVNCKRTWVPDWSGCFRRTKREEKMESVAKT